MVTNTRKNDLPILLPVVRGRYSFEVNLSAFTWFQVGGAAFVLYKPEDVFDLQHFLKEKSAELQYFVLGAGSNVLVRDGGYRGAVIKLGKGFSAITIENDVLIAGAAALDRTVAMFAMQHQLSGIEFLVTIPGAIGGAVAMNAGCYGFEVKDVLAWVEIVDKFGELRKLYVDDLKMSYRKSVLPEGSVIVRAAFKITPGNAADIQHNTQEYLQMREESQPTKGRTGGSTFKNPIDAKAWELIDKAGCRGLTMGGAKISEKHCNFMLNTGGASAEELECLGELVRQKVKETSNQNLEWEIIRVGDR
ncbi:MAG: UDP-N-acetylmuramate dehydrogenase [Proteobacteria bacterium]|nr:UDP-N-acetylmuramate dehydrogenase [Pseudomonadota bacterium]